MRQLAPSVLLFAATVLTACGDTDKKKLEKPFEGPAVINEKVTARDLILNDSLAKTKVVPFNERPAGQKDMIRDEVARAAIAAEMEAARAVMIALEGRNDSIRRAEQVEREKQENQEKIGFSQNAPGQRVERKEASPVEKPPSKETDTYGGVMSGSRTDTAVSMSKTADTAQTPPRQPVRSTNIGKRVGPLRRSPG